MLLRTFKGSRRAVGSCCCAWAPASSKAESYSRLKESQCITFQKVCPKRPVISLYVYYIGRQQVRRHIPCASARQTSSRMLPQTVRQSIPIMCRYPTNLQLLCTVAHDDPLLFFINCASQYSQASASQRLQIRQDSGAVFVTSRTAHDEN